MIERCQSPRSAPASRGEQRWAQAQTIEQHRLRKLIVFRTECHANSQPGSFGDTARSQGGIFQGASYCALKDPKGLLKLLI